jgi:hypothetical protein
MNVEMRIAILLGAVLLLAGCGGVSRSDYIARNEAIVRSLPVFPGAVKTHEISARHRSGYTTTVAYRVPRGTNDGSVLRFYETQLGPSGWSGVTDLGTDFTKDRAFLVVDTAFLTPAQRRLGEQMYAVMVDYRGNRS